MGIKARPAEPPYTIEHMTTQAMRARIRGEPVGCDYCQHFKHGMDPWCHRHAESPAAREQDPCPDFSLGPWIGIGPGGGQP